MEMIGRLSNKTGILPKKKKIAPISKIDNKRFYYDASNKRVLPFFASAKFPEFFLLSVFRRKKTRSG